MELWALLLCPNTMASTMHYKTKLQVHNFTVFILKSKKVYCFIWNETEGDWNFFFHICRTISLKLYFLGNTNLQELVIWSDGCGCLNRNVEAPNAYFALARKHGIRIVQKYLVAG